QICNPSMSPLIQVKIHFNPPLPPLRNQLMHRMPKGSVIKLHLDLQNGILEE
ncbi:hypothetical protein CEXT_508551, partial [Caerostris extrusa]